MYGVGVYDQMYMNILCNDLNKQLVYILKVFC